MAGRKTSRLLDAEIAAVVGHLEFPPNTLVCCSYRAGHKGKVIAIDDPRAWANTAAFPEDKPSRAAVKAHVKNHPHLGTKELPVLYPFGVRWDSIASLTRR